MLVLVVVLVLENLMLSWRRKCRQDYRFAVPKGLMIVARYEVPGTHEKQVPSRSERSDPHPGLIYRPNRGTPIGPSQTLYGTVLTFRTDTRQ